MTNKKFTLEYENEEICQIYENDNCMSGEDVVDLLNELHEENEQLKQSYTQLKYRHGLLHDECIDVECERDELKKENEQLKCEIELLQNSLDMNEGKKVKLE